jgi:hypothetical protein
VLLERRSLSDAADSLRGAVGFVLVFAAAMKLWSPSSVATALGAAKLPFAGRPRFAASLVAGVEIVAAGALVVATSRWLALPAAALLVLFAVYLVLLHRKAPGVGCACFGSSSETGSGTAAFRLVALGAALSASLALAKPRGMHWPTFVAGVEGATLLILVTESLTILRRFRTRFST